jgi:hypothetical protein
MNLANSADEPVNGVVPKSASRALILGSAELAVISLLSLSMISLDVFLGAPIPFQPLASKPGTKHREVAGQAVDTDDHLVKALVAKPYAFAQTQLHPRQ